MRNIQFNYLYRDAGNYKVFGHAIFSNPDGLDIDQIEKSIKLALIDGQFFEPAKWGLTQLTFADWDDEEDHFWNEYESVEVTNAIPTATLSITELLIGIRSTVNSF